MDMWTEPLLTVKEVAALLKISYFAVLALIKRGRLKASKISKTYRIAPADLAEFLQRTQKQGED